MKKFFKEESKKIEESIFEKEKVDGREVAEELYRERKEEIEKKELLVEKERAIREKLEEEIAKMALNPNLEEKAKKKAVQIRFLGKKGKLQRLLDIAEEKGVAFAIGVAKSLRDPYVLDALHDILARDKLYKKFKK